MIDEKHIDSISIVAMILSIIFVVSAVFITPNKEIANETSYNIENVLNKDKITDINIEIKDSDWQWLLDNATKEEYRSGNITINGETFYNVGIRPKGNSSLKMVASDDTTDRYSLKIDFGKYVDGQTYHGLEKLVLNNMISDTTYMKEYLSYDLYELLGVATPEYSYSNIKLNGEDWGLYLAVETIEERFLEKQYGTSEGNLYKPESMEMGGGMPEGGMGKKQPNENGDNNDNMGPVQGENMIKPEDSNKGNDMVSMKAGNMDKSEDADGGQEQGKQNNQGNKGPGNMPGNKGSSGGANLKYTDDKQSSYSTIKDSKIFKTTTNKDFDKVVDMIKNLNQGTNLEECLDVKEILAYFAVNTFLVNLDSYSGGMYHNYYLYEKDGVFQILPWDLNMSFAGYNMSDSTKAINFPIDSPVTGELEDAPLISKLLEVDEYKEIYHEYLQKIIDEYINNGKFESSVTNLDNLINNYVKTDATAFCTYEEYEKSIPQLITFGKDRAKSVTKQLSGEQPSTTYGDVTTTVNLSTLGSMGTGKQGKEVGVKDNDAKEKINNNEASAEKNGNESNKENNNINNQEMPPMENMNEVMEIIKNADVENLTSDQKEKLKELGVDDNMLSMLKNKEQGNMPQMGMNGPTNAGNKFEKSSIIEIAASIILLLVGLIFVKKFKRKK